MSSSALLRGQLFVRPRRLPVVASAMLLCLAAPLLSAKAHAMKIQSVRSPGGIDAWLVQEHAVPLLALRFAFDGGSAQDPVGKEGLANFLGAMLDEGAGELDSTKFQERMEELAFRMSFEDSRDALLRQLRDADDQPRALDRDAPSRRRPSRGSTPTPSSGCASNSCPASPSRPRTRTASPATPGARSPSPAIPMAVLPMVRPRAIASITQADLEGFRKRTFARENLKVVAVGDIDAAQLGALLDRVFGDLPAKADLAPVADHGADRPRTNSR